jgi:hypothetical protein
MTRLTTLIAHPGTLVLALAVAAVGARTNWRHADITESRYGTLSLLAQPGPAKGGQIREYYGTARCKQCHVNGIEAPGEPICRGTEMPIWQQQDKHAQAYDVLLDERARRMGSILGWRVHRKKECLACHTAWPEEKPGAQLVVAKNFKRDEGVSCVACHGPDITVTKDQELRPGWVNFHAVDNQTFNQNWRKKERSKKEADYGMTDLWDPVKRTRLCASCHIGDLARGRVVTHEMYAAGHPPLPGFEVVTFSHQMPRHWQYLKEKDKSILDLLDLKADDAALEETHLLAIGGLVVFETNLKLLEGQAATTNWPELAHFDCYACHHELKSKSWRQVRGFVGKPGRPPLREWPTALVELGLWHAAGTDAEAAKLLTKFQDQLAALQAVFDAQPFGQRDKVIPQVKALREWIDLQVKEIQKRIQDGGYSAEASAKLLGHLLDMQRPNFEGKGKQPVPDFDSARQLAWAYQVLYLEKVSKHDPKARQKQAIAMNAQAAWKGLNDYLLLTLPEGQKKLEGYLATNLNHCGNYEPREFFKYLGAALKEFSPK